MDPPVYLGSAPSFKRDWAVEVIFRYNIEWLVEISHPIRLLLRAKEMKWPKSLMKRIQLSGDFQSMVV